MPPVEIAGPPRAATLLPRLPLTVRPLAALVGALGAAVATAAVALAGASPFAALAAVPALLVSRELGDYRGARRIVPVGLVVVALGVVGMLLLPGARIAFEIVAGVGSGILLPATIALVAAPDSRATGAIPTPRIVLPRRFAVPVAARRAHGIAIALAVAAGSLMAAGAVLGGWTPLVSGALALVLVLAALRVAFAAGDPTARSEAAGAVLLPVAAVTGLGLAAAAIATLVLPSVPAVLAVGAVGILGLAVALAGGRRPGAESLSTTGRGYRAAVKAFDQTVPLAPQRAATARSAAEVARAIRAARSHGLGVRTHSTGHAAGTVNPVSDGALIKVLIDEPVTVDASRRTVRIPAGTAWRDVVLAITPHGLGAPHGSSSHVGAIGYLLRGGLSAYGRTTGLAANSIESIEIVLADGELVTADREHHAELFWALRGGGGGLGIVTAVTVRLFDLARVVTGTTIWSIDHAAELTAYWDSWRADAPREITTSLRVMDFPGFPGLPRAIVGRPLLVIDGSVVAPTVDDVSAAESIALGLLDGLRSIATPLLDSFRVATPLETAHTHMDPPIGPPHTSDHLLLESTGPEAVAAFLAEAGSEQPVSSMELRQLGGALAEPAAEGGALSHYRGDLAYWGLGIHSKSLSREQIVERLDRVRDSLSPWDSGYTVPTFSPDASRPQRTIDESTARRVAEIRGEYDPDGVFAGDVAAGAVAR